MAVSYTLTGTLQVTDGVSSTPLSKPLSFTYSGTLMALMTLSVAAAPTVIALPISPTQLVFIKNTHATQTLQVTWTPNGGASVVVQTLVPGSCILLAQVTAAQGITALTLEGSGAATTCDVYLLG